MENEKEQELESGNETETQETVEQETEQKSYSQSDLDKAVQKALSTRERKLKEEFEHKSLVEQRKYKELWEKAEAEKNKMLLASETTKVLSEKGLTDLANLFDGDYSNLDSRLKAAETVENIIKRQVETRIKEISKTPTPPKSAESTTAKTPDQMTPKEWAEYKKQNGIH